MFFITEIGTHLKVLILYWNSWPQLKFDAKIIATGLDRLINITLTVSLHVE